MISSLIGTHVSYDYPLQFVTLPDHSAHRGQMVLVLCECADAEGPEDSCEQMYRIRALDGWEGDAWITELSTPGAITPHLLGQEAGDLG